MDMGNHIKHSRNDVFYNTTKLSGRQLELEELNAGNQEEMVLHLFMKYPLDYLTPFMVQTFVNHTFNKEYPITSIRRAMTNLTNKGRLTKSNIMHVGNYGKPCHTWKLKR